jgi:mono/diheme cytochrome c family protein
MASSSYPAAAVAVCALFATAASASDLPAWAADPALPGPSLPAAGRSLFDHATADGVPFPFEALVRKIETRAGCRPGQCTTAVLIPLGRSLQRTAATPDFFAFPRAVVAFTGEGTGPMLARDRIYLGYQEKANLVEVISYNEGAARFEFQFVRDYREGGTPRVSYANRSVCTACHQNHAPIFSRQVWDETNANPRIAARLMATGRRFYGIPVQRGVDLPNAIDDAVQRANRIAVTQRIWREACDPDCRRSMLIAALQYRLSGERAFDAEPLAGTLARSFAARWPAGLAIPNAEIPNRDPLTYPTGTTAVAQAHVAASHEPLAPRPPLEVWAAGDPLLVRRTVAGLAELIAESDVRDLDTALARGAATARRRTVTAPCVVSKERYDCAGEFTLRGDAAGVDTLSLGREALSHYALLRGVPMSRGLSARTASGARIERIVVRRTGANGEAAVTIAEDFAPARAAIEKMQWPDAPFSRARMREALGLGSRAACCADVPAGLVPPQEDVVPALPLPAAAAEFWQRCAACHDTPGPFPPNFLAGDAQRVNASLLHCAPRIFVRLAMWQTPPAARDKVPMPPPKASRDGSPWMQSEPDPGLASLRGIVADWLRAETGTPPDARAMLAHGYENLRPCLPAGV